MVPKGEDDKIGWEAFFKAGGPDSPGYRLDKLEGFDPNDAKTVAAKTPRAGCLPRQGRSSPPGCRSSGQSRPHVRTRISASAAPPTCRHPPRGGVGVHRQGRGGTRGVMLAGLNGGRWRRSSGRSGPGDVPRVRRRSASASAGAPRTGAARRGIGLHMTPAEADAKLLELQGDRDWSKAIHRGAESERARIRPSFEDFGVRWIRSLRKSAANACWLIAPTRTLQSRTSREPKSCSFG